VLVLVMNNHWGISTPYAEVVAGRTIAERAGAYGIRWGTVDGNDVEAAWAKLTEVMQYIRTERRPFVLEAFVSRLHGHSSSSGAARVTDERDCLVDLEDKLVAAGRTTREACAAVREQYAEEALQALYAVREEPEPDSASVFDHAFA
jgi:2-oxoisovalerate dehydrogenase E1 component alpha subunit